MIALRRVSGLDLQEDNESTERYWTPLTAVYVDRRMPSFADETSDASLRRYPSLIDRWCYVQADLSAVEVYPSCLIASVHACSNLRNYLIDIEKGGGNMPFTIVPCCHMVGGRNGYRPHVSGTTVEEVKKRAEERNIEFYSESTSTPEPALVDPNNGKHRAVADVVDSVRRDTLLAALDQDLLAITNRWRHQQRRPKQPSNGQLGKLSG